MKAHLHRLIAAFALVAFSPFGPSFAQSPQSPPQAARVEQFKLDNGFTVLVKPDHRAPTAVQMVWVRVGSMDEVDGWTGIAHILEHMLFKGTKLLKANEFSQRVAALGGR